MRTKTTITPRLEILFTLATHREMEQYKMPKETDLSYRTILRKLKILEHKNVQQIKLLRTEPSEKGGKEKKIYAITLIGMLHVLKEHPGVAKDFDAVEKMIRGHPDMLLTFEKWPFFEKHGQEKAVLTYLGLALLDFFAETAISMLSGRRLEFRNMNEMRDYIDSHTLLGSSDDRLRLEFLRTCKEDENLRNFIDKQLALRIENFKKVEADKVKWDKL